MSRPASMLSPCPNGGPTHASAWSKPVKDVRARRSAVEAAASCLMRIMVPILLGTVLGGVAEQARADVPNALIERIAAASADVAAACRARDPASADYETRLLDHISGFAQIAGTTGGAGKPIALVTNVADDAHRPPPGSLRFLVKEAESAGGGWIGFSPELGRDATIRLAAGLRLPSNVTLDGNCSGVTLTTEGKLSILYVVNASNVVIAGLHLLQTGPRAEQTGDCVSIRSTADRVWVFGNRIGGCGDGLVDVTRPDMGGTPTRVTIARNIFENHDKSMGIGTWICKGSVPCPDLLQHDFDWSHGIQVTLQENLFWRTGQRHPRVSGEAYVHMVDNLVAFEAYIRPSGKGGSSYGAYAGYGGRLLIDDSLFVNLNASPASAVCAELSPTCRTDAQVETGEAFARGAIRLDRDRSVGDASFSGDTADKVPAPPYSIVAPCSPGPNPVTFADCLIARIGDAN